MSIASLNVIAPRFDASPSVREEHARQQSNTLLTVQARKLLDDLEDAFRQSFVLFDPATESCDRITADWLPIDLFGRTQLLCDINRGESAEIIDEEGPVLVLGVPLPKAPGSPGLLAIATLKTAPLVDTDELSFASGYFGVDAEVARRWFDRCVAWPPHGAVELARALAGKNRDRETVSELRSQLSDVSAGLLNTYEELTLLHRLTDMLTISCDENELSQMAIEWLADVVPAESIAVIWHRLGAPGIEPNRSPLEPPILHGRRLSAPDRLGELLEHLRSECDSGCLVINCDRTGSPDWRFPEVREMVSVPIRSNSGLAGYLVALNRRFTPDGEREFGTLEANLISSVSAILGVHAGNLSLFRAQKEFFAQVVLALSSAIDAKDPYTCGHSDRVARIAVCLAGRLGCSAEELNTIYLSGLLHDIGKIGIDDSVLRKPDKLTPEEYEHIKSHPELGYKILQGVKELDAVLPVVLHHHEAWDGSGYPAGLVGEDCPRLARIVAVADSIDAMGSDRPYRKGMPQAKLESILREGAGTQWDPQAVEAYFQVQDAVHAITSSDREPLSLEDGHWNGALSASSVRRALCLASDAATAESAETR